MSREQFVYDKEGRPTSAVLSADRRTLTLGYRGCVEVHGWDKSEESKWKQVGGGIDRDGNTDFGGSVSLNGDRSRVAVGGDGSSSGRVAVYEREGEPWRVLGGEIGDIAR